MASHFCNHPLMPLRHVYHIPSLSPDRKSCADRRTRHSCSPEDRVGIPTVARGEFPRQVREGQSPVYLHAFLYASNCRCGHPEPTADGERSSQASTQTSPTRTTTNGKERASEQARHLYKVHTFSHFLPPHKRKMNSPTWAALL